MTAMHSLSPEKLVSPCHACSTCPCLLLAPILCMYAPRHTAVIAALSIVSLLLPLTTQITVLINHAKCCNLWKSFERLNDAFFIVFLFSFFQKIWDFLQKSSETITCIDVGLCVFLMLQKAVWKSSLKRTCFRDVTRMKSLVTHQCQKL